MTPEAVSERWAIWVCSQHGSVDWTYGRAGSEERADIENRIPRCEVCYLPVERVEVVPADRERALAEALERIERKTAPYANPPDGTTITELGQVNRLARAALESASPPTEVEREMQGEEGWSVTEPPQGDSPFELLETEPLARDEVPPQEPK